MIVDAHHHFWDLSLGRHPWLTHAPRDDFRYGDYSAICRNYLPEDYARDTARQPIVASVYVETEWDLDDKIGETRWLADVRAQLDRPTVAVAHAVRARRRRGRPRRSRGVRFRPRHPTEARGGGGAGPRDQGRARLDE